MSVYPMHIFLHADLSWGGWRRSQVTTIWDFTSVSFWAEDTQDPQDYLHPSDVFLVMMSH